MAYPLPNIIKSHSKYRGLPWLYMLRNCITSAPLRMTPSNNEMMASTSNVESKPLALYTNTLNSNQWSTQLLLRYNILLHTNIDLSQLIDDTFMNAVKNCSQLLWKTYLLVFYICVEKCHTSRVISNGYLWHINYVYTGRGYCPAVEQFNAVKIKTFKVVKEAFLCFLDDQGIKNSVRRSLTILFCPWPHYADHYFPGRCFFRKGYRGRKTVLAVAGLTGKWYCCADPSIIKNTNQQHNSTAEVQ